MSITLTHYIQFLLLEINVLKNMEVEGRIGVNSLPSLSMMLVADHVDVLGDKGEVKL